MSSDSSHTQKDKKSAMLRLMTDYKQLNESSLAGASASPVDDNMFLWNCTIFGPSESPWEGGVYNLLMMFPDNYPDKPPKARFTTPMFHPNIYNDGSVCCDFLQSNWRPIYTVESILTSLQSLLTDPNCSSPANPEAAKLYSSDRKKYNRTIRSYAEKSVGM